MRFFIIFLTLCSLFTLTGELSLANEGVPAAGAGEGGEKKPEPEEKPKADSAISSVSELPAVKAWAGWMTSQGGQMTIWGESIELRDDGQKCWGIAVGNSQKISGKEQVKVWRHFCVTQGGSIWVEHLPSEAGFEGPRFTPYDKWVSSCSPTPSSPGDC